MRWAAAARHWPLAVPLLAAAWLRFQSLSAGVFHGDAAEYAEVARSLSRDPRDLAYPDIEGFGPTPFVSQPPLVLYLFAAAIRMTGSAELGPLAVSALLGTATVALVYALGTMLDGRWTGAAGAAFLAVLPYHVRASREAQLDAAFAFFVALAVLAFILWSRRPTDLRAIAAGCALAAATFSKLPGFAIFLVLAVPLLMHALQARGTPGGLRRVARHAALAIAPTALLWLLYVGLLWSLNATADLLLKLEWQAGRFAGADTVSRPWHWYFTDDVGLVAQVGLLLMALACVGLVLLAASLARDPATRPGRVALVLWPVVLLALLSASQRKEWFYAIPVQPAIALLAAWPIGSTIRWAAREARQPRPSGVAVAHRTWSVAAVLILASAAAWSPAAAVADGPGGFGTGVREAALHIHAEDPDAVQIGTTLGRFTLHFYNGQPTYHYWLNHTFVEDGIRAGKVRYAVVDTYVNDPGEQAWLAGLVAAHGTLVQEHRSDGAVHVQVYRLEP